MSRKAKGSATKFLHAEGLRLAGIAFAQQRRRRNIILCLFGIATGGLVATTSL
jgi:hypothetical protein